MAEGRKRAVKNRVRFGRLYKLGNARHSHGLRPVKPVAIVLTYGVDRPNISRLPASRDAHFSMRRRTGPRRFGFGAGGGRMIPAASRASRTSCRMTSRTLAVSMSRASSSIGCGRDHFRCS